MVAELPDNTPVTKPVSEPTVATDVEPLLQAPPVNPGAVSIIEAPAQTAVGPLMVGVGFTVTTTLPVIEPEHRVEALVPVIVYVPTAICSPKSKLLPVPATGGPAIAAPLYN